MGNTKVLVIEDEKRLARLVELELQHAGYDVHLESNGRQGLSSVQYYEPDIVLLDLMLPGMDGMEVCKRIRSFSVVPIIMLTARSETADKVEGLDIGANDYITKPFHMMELLARVRAALRSSGDAEKPAALCVHNLLIDPAGRTAKRGETELSLTKREFDLLEFLARNRGIVLTRGQILEHVWGDEYDGEANIVDVYIRYLRGKVDEPFETKLIHTVRGIGYVLDKKTAAG
ncbi:MAG: response regulator transcription factor [Ethanoligenens sp.]